MTKYASGKNAWYICDRTGWRYRRKDMRKEWNGLLVGKDVYEPKHPQLEPRRRNYADPQAIKDARPDRVEPYKVYVGVPQWNAPAKRSIPAITQIGSVTVTTS